MREIPKRIPSTGHSVRWLRILIAVTIAMLLLAAYLTQKANLNEYYLYLTEERKDASFAFSELSEEWTEQYITDRFVGYPMSCHPYRNGARACGVDVKSHNSVPAMFISFFLYSDRLQEVAINVPLWSHGEAERSMQRILGKPTSAQLLPRSGVRLIGWKQFDGSGVFLNRDPNFLPPFRNSIYWRSPSSCANNACFTEVRPKK